MPCAVGNMGYAATLPSAKWVQVQVIYSTVGVGRDIRCKGFHGGQVEYGKSRGVDACQGVGGPPSQPE